MFSAPFLVTLLDRVKAIVQRVVRPAGERTRRARRNASVSAPPAISPVLRGLMQDWLSTKLSALSALMRRIEAGEMLKAPVRGPRTAHGRSACAPAARGGVSPEERLPQGFGWMCGFGPDVRGDGAAFAGWLNEPWMKAMVLAAPERMTQVIAPLLTATGERRPVWFPVRAKCRRNALPLCEGDSARGVRHPDTGGSTGDAGDVAGDRRVKPGDDGERAERTCFQTIVTVRSPAGLDPGSGRGRTSPSCRPVRVASTRIPPSTELSQKWSKMMDRIGVSILLRYRIDMPFDAARFA